MTKNKIIALVAVLSVMALGGWLVYSPAHSSGFVFENTPRAVLHEAKLAGSSKPQLAISTSGALYLLAVAGDESHRQLTLSISHDGGDTFASPVPVSEPDAGVIAHGENGHSLAQTPTAVYALWQQRREHGPPQLMFTRGSGMGHSFEKPIEIAAKGTPSFTGFSSMKVAPNGDIYAVWLDGRDQPTPPGTFGVYLAKSTDKGITFSTPMRITMGACPCCRPTLAFGDKGEVYVAWRKVFPGDIRDIVVAKSTDSASTFSEPMKAGNDGWVLHACPDSGPSMATAHGKLYVAWYSEGQGKPGVRVSVSGDGAQSFARSRIASADVLDSNHPQLSVSEDGRVLLAFQGRKPAAGREAWSPTQVFFTAVNADGEPSKPQPLPVSGKSASYPAVLSASAGRAFVAWTETTGEAQEVQLCRGRNSNR
jgi:hypothetical protein